MANHWRPQEVEAITEDYLTMLRKELAGEEYKKSEHRAMLMQVLRNRTASSIERKHQNISAVMRDLSLPYISGYKPLGNYQNLLCETAIRFLAEDRSYLQFLLELVASPVRLIPSADILSQKTDPPAPTPQVHAPRSTNRDANLRDYFVLPDLEHANDHMFDAGVSWAMNYELARLCDAGRPGLADQIKAYGRDESRFLGYSLHSFDVDGADRYVAVKATMFGDNAPFYCTPSELQGSRQLGRMFRTYRFYDCRKRPRFYEIVGPLDQSCCVEPVLFRIRTGIVSGVEHGA